MVDGSLIRLMDKPRKNGWAYYSLKKNYAVSFFFSFEIRDLTELKSSWCKLFAMTRGFLSSMS